MWCSAHCSHSSHCQCRCVGGEMSVAGTSPCPLPRPVNTNTGYWPGQPLCVTSTTTTTISSSTTRRGGMVRTSRPMTWVVVGLMVRSMTGVRCVADVGSPGPVLRAQTWPGGVRPGSTHRHQSMLQSVLSDGPQYTNSHLVSY